MSEESTPRRSKRNAQRQSSPLDAQLSTSNSPTPLDTEDTASPTVTTHFGRENEGSPSRAVSPLSRASRSSSAHQNGAQSRSRSKESSARPIGFSTLVFALRELENRITERLKEEIRLQIENRLDSRSNLNPTVERQTMESSRADDDRQSTRMFENRTDRQRRSSKPTPPSTMTSAPPVLDIESPADSPRTDRNRGRQPPVSPRRDPTHHVHRQTDNEMPYEAAPREGGRPQYVTPPVTATFAGNHPLFYYPQPVPSHVVQQDAQYSAKSNAKLCDKYTGYSHSVDVQVSLDVFTAVTIDWTDRDRLRALPRHLADEAIEWFGQEIVPEMTTIDWTECKRRMIARFSNSIRNPIIEAFDRRLSSRETVSDYFNDKRRLLVRAAVSDAVQVELLTNGMPEYYKPLIKGRKPKNATEWIETALMFERKDRSKSFKGSPESAHLNEEQESKPRKRTEFKRNDRSKPCQTKGKSDDRPPPDPCPRCKKLGFPNEWHWMRKCPRNAVECSLISER